MKKRIVVVCPGRGTYTKETLGYLRQHGAHVQDFLADIDQRRRDLDEPTISTLDGAEVFKPQVHTKGEHASSLIYACAYADFMAINRNKYEIVAVTGNSMGWYLTLAFGGALDWASGFEVVNTMGSMMKQEIIGGQVIYPVTLDNWQPSPEKMALVERVVADIKARDGHEVYISIYLGGFIVLGANRAGVAALLKELPQVENYPFQLINHAAFHTPLLQETSQRAFERLPESLFQRPKIPLIDGQGNIWQPYSTSISKLYEYTLGHQVVAPYDFTAAITVGLKEFCPDHVVLLGPGSSLGGAVGQILIQNDWFEMKSKADFTERQNQNPFVLAMGRPEQRSLVV
ncbi:MAG: ACP S-malonyltransferase [Bdellovibrionales bacterium]